VIDCSEPTAQWHGVDLLRLFHELTHVSLPTATVNAVYAAIAQHLGHVGPLPVAVGGRSRAIGRPPPLQVRYYARQTVLAEISARLSFYPVLVLQGGTDVGKSIAAVGHAAVSSSAWGWVNLRGVSAPMLTRLLDAVVAELEAEEVLTDIVLDDIELPVDPRSLETPLARVKTILGERSGHLVITSAVALPQRLSLALALPATGTISIPRFSSLRRQRIEIVRIELQRTFQESLGRLQVFRGGSAVDKSPGPEIQIHRIGIGRPLGAPHLGLDKLCTQLPGDPGDDVVLHLEQIGKFFVEPFGPEVSPGIAIDQLDVEAQPVAAALHAPLQPISHVQVTADLPEINRLTLVGEGGVPGDDERARNAREIDREALGDTVGKIFLLVIAPDICKRKHD
jgi:hypothetical protein